MIDLPKYKEYKMEDYPEQPRSISYSEVLQDCQILANQLKDYDQIVGVARSGMPYATWIAQTLGKQLGYYNPIDNGFHLVGNPAKIAFIDNNSRWGYTLNDTAVFMKEHHPDIEYTIGVMYMDSFHPHFHGYPFQNLVYAQITPFWVIEYAGFVGSFAETTKMKRFRDE